MTVKFTGEVHPFAEQFPMLAPEDLRNLVESVRDDGLQQPLVLDPEGRLLDGRNRLAACTEAEVDPSFVVHKGDPIAYIVAANVHRRHLTTGQRAMAVAIGLAEQGRRQNGRWEYGAVENTSSSESPGNWTDAMRKAGFVLDQTPHLAPRVLLGTAALAAAYDTARIMKRDADKEAVAREELATHAPDLHAAMTDGVLSFAEAGAAYAERTRESRERAEADEAEGRKWAQRLADALDLLAGLTDHEDWPTRRAATWIDYGRDVRPRVITETWDQAADGLVALRKAIENNGPTT